jgi:hypothetical protein
LVLIFSFILLFFLPSLYLNGRYLQRVGHLSSREHPRVVLPGGDPPPPLQCPPPAVARAGPHNNPPPHHPARKATTGLHQSTRAPPCHGCCPVPKAADPGCPGPDLATLVSDLPPCRGQVAAILFTPSPSNPRSSCHRGRCYHCSWERCFPSVASLSPLLAPSPSSAAPPPPRAAPPPLQPRHFPQPTLHLSSSRAFVAPSVRLLTTHWERVWCGRPCSRPRGRRTSGPPWLGARSARGSVVALAPFVFKLEETGDQARRRRARREGRCEFPAPPHHHRCPCLSAARRPPPAWGCNLGVRGGVAARL